MTGDDMASGAYGSTSGTEERESRALMKRLLTFDLGAEASALRDEEPYRDGDRNSRMLAKDVDFRVMLTVLRRDAELDEKDGDARASLQVLEGRALLSVQNEQTELGSWQMAVVDAGRPWTLRASADCTVLLTLAWPREKASA